MGLINKSWSSQYWTRGDAITGRLQFTLESLLTCSQHRGREYTADHVVVTWLPRRVSSALAHHAPAPRSLVERRVTSRVTWPAAWLSAIVSPSSVSTPTFLIYTVSVYFHLLFSSFRNSNLPVFLSMMADSSTSPTYTLGGAESTTSDEFIRSSAISSSQSPQKSAPAEDISHVKRPMNAFMVSLVTFSWGRTVLICAGNLREFDRRNNGQGSLKVINCRPGYSLRSCLLLPNFMPLIFGGLSFEIYMDFQPV